MTPAGAERADVAIIGAGIVGLATALRLAYEEAEETNARIAKLQAATAAKADVEAVAFSGGEPLMYPGIVELAKLAYEHNRPGIINIPTNTTPSGANPVKFVMVCSRIQWIPCWEIKLIGSTTEPSFGLTA